MIARVLLKFVGSPYQSRASFYIANHQILRSQTTRKLSSSDKDCESDIEQQAFNARNLLYPNLQDPIVQKIKKCTSVKELASYVSNAANLEKTHACQLILSLSQCHASMSPASQIELDLEPLMSRISQVLDELTIQEVAFSYHYLNKLKYSIKHPTMETMTNILLREIEKEEDFSPNLLHHFTAAMKSEPGLYASYLEVAALPQITRQLENCTNADDFNNLTQCLVNISNIVPLGLLDAYKRKTTEFLDEDILNETSPQLILKVLNFLNFPHWSFRNGNLLRRLMLELEENIKTFETRHLIVFNRAFSSQLESARLIPALVKRAQELLKESMDVSLLPMAMLNVTPKQRIQTTDLVRDFLQTYQISSEQSGETLQTVFKILRLLKISDVNLCDTFWTKTLNKLYLTKETDIAYVLTKQIQKYMYFNNNLGGSYRHIEFERSMIESLLKELKITLIPREFASFSSFVIAYGDVVGHRAIPRFIVDKIESLHEQFSIKDCVQISRGVQVMMESNFKRNSAELADQLDSINLSLNKSAERHLKNKKLHISELSSIIKAFTIRKGTKHSRLFNKMMSHYEVTEKLNLNSRNIREITFILTSSNFRIDPICDQFIDYILENWDHVSGDTVEKILTCCYNFSYFPEKLEVLERSSEIIVRDFNYMNGLSIVQALLALVFYKSCPQQLIAMVFSSDFIKRLEQEIAMCYSKNSYPLRVMQQVMLLNRAVCLDCPEVNVKWFQQSFIEAQSTKLPVIQSRLQKDVNSVLLSIVKTPDFLKTNRVTPYGYRIDFELTIDQYNRFVHPLPEDYHNVNYQPNVRRIAILILSSKMLCDNDANRLRGSELLRMRHLEMMGYRVVHLKVNDFKLMYRNVAEKVKYIKSLLRLNM